MRARARLPDRMSIIGSTKLAVFAGAGLGDAQHIAAGEHHGDGLGLDRRGVEVAFLGDCLKDGLGQAGV